MKYLLFIAALLSSTNVFAEVTKTCYEISSDGKTWNSPADLICTSTMDIDGFVIDNSVSLEKETRGGLSATPDSEIHFQHMSRQKVVCRDCHSEIYTLDGTNAIVTGFFNKKSIVFDGNVRTENGQRITEGKVQIFSVAYFYRSIQQQ